MLRHKSKIVLFIVLFLTFGVWLSYYSSPLISPTNSASQTIHTPNPTPGFLPLPSQPVSSSTAKSTISIEAQIKGSNRPKRHIDMLSEEMKQSIRDKLISHGPINETLRDDGLYEVRANGRFTQMPVAVQMPDGSIKIQEYSVIPEKKATK